MSRPDVVIVTGSRDWSDRRLVAETLAPFPAGTYLLHGACRGLDTIAATFGKRYGFNILAFPYFADDSGKECRNETMFAVAKAFQDCKHRVYGFAFPLPESVGTFKAIRIADRLGIAIRPIKP